MNDAPGLLASFAPIVTGLFFRLFEHGYEVGGRRLLGARSLCIHGIFNSE